ncbi:DUF305 domain-containing protein [Oryzobacter sp. R7]|uniref:DUF305 domain-containing protein n=1 Tax=Oryzobacter faecalis TaxID=3388656 RepID=UPI00398CD0A7
MPSRPARTIGTALAATLALAALAGCGSTQDHSSMPGMTSSASSAPSSAAQGDVMFAQMMIPHHEQAIEMADLALREEAQASSEVRRLAMQIRQAQDPEIATMRRWLTSWGAPTGGSMDHSMPGMMGTGDMDELEAATGEAFDRQWLTMMVAHHEGAVTMARDVLSTTTDAEVRTLAQAVIDGQQKEIATMKDLLR